MLMFGWCCWAVTLDPGLADLATALADALAKLEQDARRVDVTPVSVTVGPSRLA